jgi:ATP-dependent Clp protease ATP-binding subunit ClpC
MFELYTEKARRAIFFAHYEAKNSGSAFIETEHLLLGLLREDRTLTRRLTDSQKSIASLCKQLEQHALARKKSSTSAGLPLSKESRRVLAYAAEEASRLNHNPIGTEHLVLGLLREDQSFAAQILTERGLNLLSLHNELQQTMPAQNPPGRCASL